MKKRLYQILVYDLVEVQRYIKARLVCLAHRRWRIPSRVHVVLHLLRKLLGKHFSKVVPLRFDVKVLQLLKFLKAVHLIDRASINELLQRHGCLLKLFDESLHRTLHMELKLSVLIAATAFSLSRLDPT
jgi:hypothetical protein